jgi:hypothetical protein
LTKLHTPSEETPNKSAARFGIDGKIAFRRKINRLALLETFRRPLGTRMLASQRLSISDERRPAAEAPQVKD